MRIFLIIALASSLWACAPFQRSTGYLESPQFKSTHLETPSLSGPGELEEANEEEVTPPDLYKQGEASPSGYRPDHPFTLTWPLNHVKLNQAFRPMKKRRPHLGVDLAGTKGTAVFAAHEGRVIYAGRAFKGFGRLVIVEYDDQWASLYAHLDRIHVKQGQRVEQGQTVGTMGRTGRATGVHLHFELLHNKRPVDPIPMLNEFERLVDGGGRGKRLPASQL